VGISAKWRLQQKRTSPGLVSYRALPRGAPFHDVCRNVFMVIKPDAIFSIVYNQGAGLSGPHDTVDAMPCAATGMAPQASTQGLRMKGTERGRTGNLRWKRCAWARKIRTNHNEHGLPCSPLLFMRKPWPQRRRCADIPAHAVSEVVKRPNFQRLQLFSFV